MQQSKEQWLATRTDPMNWPNNEYFQLLIDKAWQLNVELRSSKIHELWYYRPDSRTIYIWEPDLINEPLAYLLTVFGHELGHVTDFDRHPEFVARTKDLHYSNVPWDIELSGFVSGFRLLSELGIPLAPETFAFFIAPPMQQQVLEIIQAGPQQSRESA
ncbi:MAG: hypothetical protein GX058_08705 [Firmicutes bacterium]|nr:hypothetical protein [Bacillota bacterium]